MLAQPIILHLGVPFAISETKLGAPKQLILLGKSAAPNFYPKGPFYKFKIFIFRFHILYEKANYSMAIVVFLFFN